MKVVHQATSMWSAASKFFLKVLCHFLNVIACRAGENFTCERSHRKKFSRHLEFFRQWKTGERKKI